MSSLLNEIQSRIELRRPCAVAEEWSRPTRHPLDVMSIRINQSKNAFCRLKMFYYQDVAVPNIEVHEHLDFIVLLRCLTKRFVEVGSIETSRVETGM